MGFLCNTCKVILNRTTQKKGIDRYEEKIYKGNCHGIGRDGRSRGLYPPPIAYAADTATEYHVPYSEFSQEGGTSRDSTVTWENLGPGISDDTVVIIPKDIPLGKDTKAAEYGITVKGSIPYDRKVTVTPRDEVGTLDGVNFYMHDTNPLEALKKADVPATVVQADTEWSVDEVTPEGTVKNGDISAPGLTYGSWEGILTFDINMEATDGSHTHNFVDGNCDKCGMAEDGNTGGSGNPGNGDGSDGTGDGSGGSGNPSEPGHEHNFVDGVCQDCGQKEDANGSDGNGENNGGNEGEEDSDSEETHTCTFTERVLREPTCVAGSKELKCEECQATEYVDIPATGTHTFTEGMEFCDNDGCTAKNPDYVAKNLDLGTEADIAYWNYTIDDSAKIVTLNKYKPNNEPGYDYNNPRKSAEVFASYEIDGTIYKTQIEDQNKPHGAVNSTNCFFGSELYLEEISFSDKIDTSNLTGTVQMFAGLNRLKNINWGSFDTSNVTTMSGMFEKSFKYGKENLDLSTFNTSKVTDMSFMFYGCARDFGTGLQSINLSSFDTSNVTNMNSMFSSSYHIKNLNLSGFDTSNVTNMQSMFGYLHTLENLDLSSFDTSNVTNMSYMFVGCDSLKTLDISSFNTSNVTDMSHMFASLPSLKQLDVSNFNTSKVTTMENMFGDYLSGLNILSLDLSNFDTSNVTTMEGMFEKSGLRNINVSSFDTRKVSTYADMFSGCIYLKKLDMTSFTYNCIIPNYLRTMFKNTVMLEEVSVSDKWPETAIYTDTFSGSACTGFTWK